MRFDAEISWSMMDPRPVVMYLPEQDDYMVVWNGVVLPLVHAQCIAFEFIGFWSGRAVKHELDDRYRKLYYAGAFGTKEWDHIVETNPDTFNLLRRFLEAHLNKIIPNYSKQEIVEWFNLKNAKISLEPVLKNVKAR